jgi:hypothetical protein
MKRLYLTLIFTLTGIITISYSQTKNEQYQSLIKSGWQSWLDNKPEEAINLYTKAFRLFETPNNPDENKWNSNNNDIPSPKHVPLSDRYNLSCIYALSKNKDAAFYHLFIIAKTLKWSDYFHLINDSDLSYLYSDSRWEQLKSIVLKNKTSSEAHLDQELVALLDTIYLKDQSNRAKIRATEAKFGRKSKEMDKLWKNILRQDSLNLITISNLLDSQGWPDKTLIGKRGASTIFLVIQHADKKTQEKYLPMITKAVEDDNLPKRQYAMFYDRLLLRRGEHQIYGTQLAMDDQSKDPYVLPLKDPTNVDNRRLKMGLNTMQENLNRWNLTWNVNDYIKSLPDIIARMKSKEKQQ